MSAVENYQTLYQQLVDQLPGHDVAWVRAMRETSIKRFVAQGFPTRKQEEWKYTTLQALEEDSYQPKRVEQTVINKGRWHELPLVVLDAYRIVFVDGYINRELSDIDSLPSGVLVSELSTLLNSNTKNNKLLAMFDNAQHTSDSMRALNNAFLTDGVVITLLSGVQLEKPLHLQFISSAQNNTASFVSNAIIMEQNSHATIVETHVALGEGKYTNNLQTFIHLDSDAQMEHFKLQLEGQAAIHLATTEVEQTSGSLYRNHLFAFGSRLMRNEIKLGLNGTAAECFLNGLVLAQNNQHLDTHTRIDHNAPVCKSREAYRGIATDSGRVVFDGVVTVHLDAQRSDARVTTNNLLLSRGAEIDAKPQLEIYADDVKCSHGATIGQLDEDVLFYLRSRGIEEITARNMVLLAFASHSINLCLQPDIKKIARELLFKYLPSGGQLQELLQ